MDKFDIRRSDGLYVLMAVASNQSRDPTKSATLRRQYASRLRGWFGELNTVIRRAIVERDIFGMAVNVDEPPLFRYPTDSRNTEEFMLWLRRQEEQGLFEIVTRGDNTFIRRSYGKGLRHADRALQAEGIPITGEELEQLFAQPVHRDTLQLLYTRNFEELQGITSTMNQQVSRALAEGFANGLAPGAIASDIVDRVDTIGKTRATVMARSEVINAHTEATLNRFEQMGVDRVTVKAEWSTAGDNRVCPICEALEARVFTVEEARTETFNFRNASFPVKPPAHPQCRCALLPVVETV